MAKSTLTTINQIMSIASKAHYLNGGNASKILAKDKKGIFTIEQVAETLDVNADDLKALLQNNKIMCGNYVIDENWGNGEKLSTYALRALNTAINEEPQKETNWTGIFTWIAILFVMCTLFNGATGAVLTFMFWVAYKVIKCVFGSIDLIAKSK